MLHSCDSYSLQFISSCKKNAICCSLICHVNLGFKNSDETKTLEEAVAEKTATRTDWMIEIINLFTAPILNQKFIDK